MTGIFTICPHWKEEYEHHILKDEFTQNQRTGCKHYKPNEKKGFCDHCRPEYFGHCYRFPDTKEAKFQWPTK